ncbi:MAG: extracellular solute-binding protein [Armatimonadetes bacterium]|nr:extracellular solute-binding protein [Armatimonadota bacterium]
MAGSQRGAAKPWRAILAVLVLVLGGAFLFARPHYESRETIQRKYPGRIPVRFWHMWSAEWKVVIDRIVDRYNKSQSKYEVMALSVPAGADTKFLLGAMGGDPPDVMAQWNPVIPTWAEGGMLMPFEDIMSPAEREKFERESYPIVKRVGQYKGKTYGIPIGLQVKGVFYLPEAFRKAGVKEFPKTWEELCAVTQKMTKRDANGNITRLGFMPGNWAETSALFGGGFYDFDKDELTIGNPKNLECLQSLVALRQRDGYDAVSRFQSGLNSSSFAGGWPFIIGAYAADVDGPWRVEQIAKYAPKLDYATALVPPPKGGSAGAGLGSGNFMIIPRSAKEKAGAWDFVKYWSGMTNPEVAAEFYVWGGWLPPNDAVANAPIYQKYIKEHPQFGTFVEAIKSPNIRAQPPVAYQVFLNDTVQKVEDLALRGKISPEDAVKQVQSSVDEEIVRRKRLGYDE